MKSFFRLASSCLLALAALGLAGCASPGLNRTAGEFDCGPIASRLLDPAGGTHFKAAGPFYERASDTNGLSFWAVRPLTSGGGEGDEHAASETLWPLLFTWDFQSNHSVRVLTSFYTDFNKEDPHSRWQWWCFPFWYQGRDATGTTYAALFPLGGTIRQFAWQDEVFFALWPLYIHNVQKGEHSYHVLWPVFCRENNERNDRFRIWPLYGWNIRRGDFNKQFCLWPVVSWAQYYRPGASGYGYLVFPLFGHIKRENQEEWMALPPFFRYGTSAKLTQGYAPWPFVQWKTGEIEQLYLWPFWGYKNLDHIHAGFYAWPLGWWRHLDRPGGQVHRYTFAPVWFSESAWQAEKPQRVPKSEPVPAPSIVTAPTAPATNCVARYWQCWPLCNYERIGEQSRFRTLMLWPLRHSAMIEREFAPIWTLYQHQRAGANSSDELLWGLLRRSNRGEEQSRFSLFPLVEWGHDDRAQAGGWNLLKGLIGYEREGTHANLRLLWFIKLGL